MLFLPSQLTLVFHVRIRSHRRISRKGCRKKWSRQKRQTLVATPMLANENWESPKAPLWSLNDKVLSPRIIDEKVDIISGDWKGHDTFFCCVHCTFRAHLTTMRMHSFNLQNFEVNKNFQQALYAWFIEVFALPSSLLLSYFLPYKLFYSKVFS